MPTAQQAKIPTEALERREGDAEAINHYVERIVIGYMMNQPLNRITSDDIPAIRAACGHTLITDRDIKTAIEKLERPSDTRTALIDERTTRGGYSFNGWDFRDRTAAEQFLL